MIKELSRDTLSEFNNYVFNKFKEEFDKRRTDFVKNNILNYGRNFNRFDLRNRIE